jgi:hypothetical protein
VFVSSELKSPWEQGPYKSCSYCIPRAGAVLTKPLRFSSYWVNGRMNELAKLQNNPKPAGSCRPVHNFRRATCKFSQEPDCHNCPVMTVGRWVVSTVWALPTLLHLALLVPQVSVNLEMIEVMDLTWDCQWYGLKRVERSQWLYPNLVVL